MGSCFVVHWKFCFYLMLLTVQMGSIEIPSVQSSMVYGILPVWWLPIWWCDIHAIPWSWPWTWFWWRLSRLFWSWGRYRFSYLPHVSQWHAAFFLSWCYHYCRGKVMLIIFFRVVNELFNSLHVLFQVIEVSFVCICPNITFHGISTCSLCLGWKVR